MRESGSVPLCCLALLLSLSSVTAIRELKSLNDLKKMDFGNSVPKHSLLLLHWFANEVHIDNNNVIWLTFEPEEEYGSHHYGNFERILPQGGRYYTIGNLHQDTSAEIPDYVVHPHRAYRGQNRDRIVFCVAGRNLGGQDAQRRIVQVFLTQHYDTSEQQGTRYDPDHTYQVTNLLRELRQFSVGGDQGLLNSIIDRLGSNADARHIVNTWGAQLALLGLFLFIVIEEKHWPIRNQNRTRPSARRDPPRDVVVNIPARRPNHTLAGLDWNQEEENTRVEVRTGNNGNAQIIWKNVPRNRLSNGAMVVLFRNDLDQQASSHYKCIGNKEWGSWDTSTPLNDGMQARLHKVRTRFCCMTAVGEEIRRGPEFKNPGGVSIEGHDAKIQLFVKDGKACARLSVGNTFDDWKLVFANSWVGFYSSVNKATNDYEWWKWQWATKFKPIPNIQDSRYDVYEYHSGLAMAPGVQARFMISGTIEKARTEKWSQ